jgi:UDP-N-acetylglucosamine enolpyruvyl transferase
VWRGYENLTGKLLALGADIELIPDEKDEQEEI